ncbi:hypothetical protein [Variovorax sp. RO1]|uniref:hypothetical protein n=1 Tax=Variovorax sp. RO1 TaxID=2066034 RepID=UPI0011813043|nr:hypothetical protein [Variovorax sp. RO1]
MNIDRINAAWPLFEKYCSTSNRRWRLHEKLRHPNNMTLEEMKATANEACRLGKEASDLLTLYGEQSGSLPH